MELTNREVCYLCVCVLRACTEVSCCPGLNEQGIELFMPFSFLSVNNMAKAYFAADHRYVYTTPKSFLELLKAREPACQQTLLRGASCVDRFRSAAVPTVADEGTEGFRCRDRATCERPPEAS